MSTAMTSIAELFGGDTTKEIKSFSDMADALEAKIPILTKVLESFNTAGGGLEGIFSSLNTMAKSLGSVISSHPIIGVATALTAVALPAVISAIDDSIHRTERLIEAGQKAKQTISDTISDYKNKESIVNNAGERFDELRVGVNQQTNQNISLANDEYAEYLSLCNEIKGIYPELVTGFDAQGNAILNLGTNAQMAKDQLNEMLEVNKQAANYRIAQNTQSVHEGIMAEISELENAKKELTNDYDADINTKNTVNSTVSQIEELRNGTQNYIIAENEMLEAVKNALSSFGIWNYNTIDNLVMFSQADLDNREALADHLEKVLTPSSNRVLSQLSPGIVQNLYEQSLIDAQIQAKWQEDLQNFIDSAAANINYTSLPEELQTGINSAILGLSRESFIDQDGNFNLGDYEDVNDFTQKNFIDPIAYAFTQLSTDNPDILQAQENAQTAFTTLFSLPKDKLNVEDYKNHVEEQLNIIKLFFDDVYGPESDLKFNQFSEQFGFGSTLSNGTILNSAEDALQTIKDVATKKGEDLKQLKLDELTVEQLVNIKAIVTDQSYGGTVAQAIDEIVNGPASDKPKSVSFSSLLTPDAEGNQAELSKKIDNFQADMEHLQSIIDAVNNGEDVDLTDIRQQFEELTGYTGGIEGLGEALSRLKLNKISKFSREFQDSVSNVYDPEVASHFFNELTRSIDLSNIEIPDFRQRIFLNMRENSSDFTRSYWSIADQLASEFGDNELAKEIILRLSLDTDSANWDYETWVQNITKLYNEKLENISFENLIQDGTELSEIVSSYTSEMQALTAAKQRLTKSGGILDERQIGELLKTCPQLSSYLDDLEGGIDSLIAAANNETFDYFAEQIQHLREIGKDADADALELYAQSIMDSANEIEGAFIRIGGLKIDTPNLAAWENSGESPGSIYEKMLSGYDAAKKAYENNQIGDPAFKAFAKMISPTGSDDPLNFAENMGKFERYFQDGSDGCMNFLNDLEALGLAEQENGQWTYTLGNSMEELKSTAEKLGIGFEPMMVIFGQLETFGFQNDFFLTEEDGVRHVEDLYSELAAEKRRLAEIQANPNTEDYESAVEASKQKIAEYEARIEQCNETLDNMSANSAEEIAAKAEYAKEVARDLIEQINDTDDLQLKESLQQELDDFAQDYHLAIGENDIISLDEALANIDDVEIDFSAKGSELDGQIDQLSQKLQELRAGDPDNLDTAQIASSEAVLEFMIAKKQQLEAPAVMNISSEQLAGIDAQLSNAVLSVQNFQLAYNELQRAQTLGIDTAEAQANLDQAREALSLIDDDTQKTLGITVEGLSDVELVHEIATMDLSSFDGINKLSYEFHFINEETLDTIRQKINQLPKEVRTTSSVTDQATSVLTSIKNLFDELNGKTAHTYVTTTTMPRALLSLPLPSGSSANNSSGSPVQKTAQGPHTDGAVANGSTGELRDTVALTGELGPEMVVRGNRYFTVGDHGPEMVHLKKGDIVFNHRQTKDLLSKGHTGERGRALVSGNARGGLGPNLSSGSASAPSASNTGTTGKTGTNTSKGNGGDRDSLDWIEKLLKRLQREIKNLKTIADSVFHTFSQRNKALSEEISGVSEEIDKQNAAYKRYMAEAESVGLRADLKTKVQNGTIDIEKYDEDTKKKISEYTTWYEKALDCKDAVAELGETLSGLYKQQFDNIITQWEKKLQNLEHSADRINNLISRRSDYAGDHVTPDNARQASQTNIKDYQNLIKNNQKQIDRKSQELAEFRQFLDSGKIPKDTEAWYDALAKIQSVESEIDTLNAEIIRTSNDISDEYVKLFDSVSREYGNKLSLSEHLASSYDNALTQAEAKGLTASAAYYEMLQGIEGDNIAVMKQQLADLQQALYQALASGEIEKGSQDWYDMTEEINGVSESIQKAETQMIEFGNSIREISWERFDFLQDQISRLTDETEFYLKLIEDSDLFDENGITSEGMAALGLHGQNYKVYMSQADQYAQELKRLGSDLAANPADTKLIERKQELLELQRKSVLAAEDEKKAIKSLVNDGIDAELDRLKELSSQYIDALDSQKDLYDYQKNIEEQTKKISTLQKQLLAYENDTSEETRSKIQKIKLELDEARDELEETQYDRYISDQKRLLDDLYDEYEKALNQRLDDITVLLENVLLAISENAGPISDTLNTLASDIGVSLSGEMSQFWTNSASIQSALESIRDFTENLSRRADEEADNAKKKIADEENAKKKADQQAQAAGASNPDGTKPAAKAAVNHSATDLPSSGTGDKNAGQTTPAPGSSKPSKSTRGDGKIQVGDKVKYVSGEYYNDSYGGNPHGHMNRGGYVYITKINAKGTYPYHISTGKKLGSGDRGWLKKKQISGYAKGAKQIADNELAWTNENWETDGFETYVRKSDGAILTPLAKDSRLYNAMASENMWKAANDPSGYIRRYSDSKNILVKNVPASAPNTQIHMGDSQFNISLPSVKNYEEFKSAMQKDKTFARFIQSITIDPIAGKSINNKNRFHF